MSLRAALGELHCLAPLSRLCAGPHGSPRVSYFLPVTVKQAGNRASTHLPVSRFCLLPQVERAADDIEVSRGWHNNFLLCSYLDV
jgi:hypothetical protein